jgi:hypothetical protein
MTATKLTTGQSLSFYVRMGLERQTALQAQAQEIMEVMDPSLSRLGLGIDHLLTSHLRVTPRANLSDEQAALMRVYMATLVASRLGVRVILPLFEAHDPATALNRLKPCADALATLSETDFRALTQEALEAALALTPDKMGKVKKEAERVWHALTGAAPSEAPKPTPQREDPTQDDDDFSLVSIVDAWKATSQQLTTPSSSVSSSVVDALTQKNEETGRKVLTTVHAPARKRANNLAPGTIVGPSTNRASSLDRIEMVDRSRSQPARSTLNRGSWPRAEEHDFEG